MNHEVTTGTAFDARDIDLSTYYTVEPVEGNRWLWQLIDGITGKLIRYGIEDSEDAAHQAVDPPERPTPDPDSDQEWFLMNQDEITRAMQGLNERPNPIPADLVRRYLLLTKNLDPSSDRAVTQWRAVESDLIDAIESATGIDHDSLITYGSLIPRDGLTLLGQGETPVLTVDTNGRIEWLNWTGEVTHG